MLSYLKQTIGSIPVAHIGQYKTVADAAKLIRDKDTTSILVTKKDSSEPAPPANSVMMAERIPGAWLVQIRGGGHGLIFQYPNEFSEILETFFYVS